LTKYVTAVLFALIWCAVSGSFSIPNIVLGVALGALALYIVRERVASEVAFARAWGVLALAGIFLVELLLSATRVAKLVLTPRMDIRPGIFAYPLTVDRDFEITLLANLITLTPGTLSVDVSPDRKTLYVHALDCSDLEANIRDIKTAFERRILAAFR
jgi:multicomponent Na+:H+ antiporter subunit E